MERTMDQDNIFLLDTDFISLNIFSMVISLPNQLAKNLKALGIDVNDRESVEVFSFFQGFFEIPCQGVARSPEYLQLGEMFLKFIRESDGDERREMTLSERAELYAVVIKKHSLTIYETRNMSHKMLTIISRLSAVAMKTIGK